MVWQHQLDSRSSWPAYSLRKEPEGRWGLMEPVVYLQRFARALLARLSASANSPLSLRAPDEALAAIGSRPTCANAPTSTAGRCSAPFMVFGLRRHPRHAADLAA